MRLRRLRSYVQKRKKVICLNEHENTVSCKSAVLFTENIYFEGVERMIHHKSCGAVVYTRENSTIKYVLVQQFGGFYGFPKGHMEENETEIETALREIQEEVGLNPVIIEGFKTFDEHRFPNDPDQIKQITYFLAEYENQEITFQKEELLGAVLVTFEEAMDLFTFDSSKRILREANDFLLNK